MCSKIICYCQKTAPTFAFMGQVVKQTYLKLFPRMQECTELNISSFNAKNVTIIKYKKKYFCNESIVKFTIFMLLLYIKDLKIITDGNNLKLEIFSSVKLLL